MNGWEIGPKAALETVLFKEDYFKLILNFIWHRLNAILVMCRTHTAKSLGTGKFHGMANDKSHFRRTLRLAQSSVWYLTLSWRRPLSYRNQSSELLRKSMHWFLYDNGLRHKRVNGYSYSIFVVVAVVVLKIPSRILLSN